MQERIDNANAKVFYGLHFYPGVAEYNEEGKEPMRVFINEDTIRKMSPTFEGCPIFVKHRDEINQNINELRKEAEGWVVESFFNKADGKHWAKIVVCTTNAEECVRKGYRLSNAYFPEQYGPGGVWNGMEYDSQIVAGRYEHLAIVDDPRYVESIILTPDEFKSYNLEKERELVKLSNSNSNNDKETPMFELFTKKKVENAADLEKTMVVLPKSKKELSIANALTELDKVLNMHGYASGDHMVKINDKEEMSVNDLVKAYQAKCNDDESMDNAEDDEESKENAEDDESKENAEDDDEKNCNDDDEESKENAALDIDQMGERETGGDPSFSNDDDEEDEKPKKSSKKNALEKKRNAREKAMRLKMANELVREQAIAPTPFLGFDGVQRGVQRYGSGR